MFRPSSWSAVASVQPAPIAPANDAPSPRSEKHTDLDLDYESWIHPNKAHPEFTYLHPVSTHHTLQKTSLWEIDRVETNQIQN